MTADGEPLTIEAGDGHLSAVENDVEVPTDVFNFSETRDRFTGVQTTEARLASLRFARQGGK